MNAQLQTLVDEIKALNGMEDETESRIIWGLFSNEDIGDIFYSSDIYQDASKNDASWRAGTDAVEQWLSDRSYEFIESEGGGEGEGEYCHGVIRLGGVHLKADWSYYSYNGPEYDYIANSVKEVTPQKRVITVYE